MSANRFTYGFVLTACLAACTAARGQELLGPVDAVDAVDGGWANPVWNAGPEFGAPELPEGTWGLPHNPPAVPWGISLTVGKATTIGENILEKQLFFFGEEVGQESPEFRSLGGFAISGELAITPIFHTTVALDLQGTFDGDSWSVPTGPHGVVSVLFNVDPLTERLFYGIGVDVYSPPSLDVFDINGGISAPIIGQLRGGVGYSTPMGDWIFRGGRSLGDDFEPFANDLSTFPGPVYQFFGRTVEFTSQHFEGGLFTAIGNIHLNLLAGWRSDPDSAYFACEYKWYVTHDGSLYVGGDLYIDELTNYSASLGVTFNFGGARDFGFRRVLEPLSVGKANKLTKYGLFQLLTADRTP